MSQNQFNERPRAPRGFDNYGNPQKVVGLKATNGAGFKGYVEINNVLYKLYVSPSNNEKYGMWCSVTKLKANRMNATNKVF